MSGCEGDAPMRVVVVNHMHPSVPHVSGMRAWYFAVELAARGHQVILICQRVAGAQAVAGPADVGAALETHDWRSPLVIAVEPRPSAMLDRVRSGQTAPIVRKALVVWSYVRKSGMFSDFSRGADPWLAPLAAVFKPHVVWGIFGNTDCWLIAQRLGHVAGCAWVGDMKDAWDRWVPRGLRTVVARRFRDMSAATSNAAFHAGVMERWFPPSPAVVYSGVTPDFLQQRPQRVEGFRVTLVGATYDRRTLSRFVAAFSQWVQGIPSAERERITLCYAGSDSAQVEGAVAGLESLVRLDIRGQRPLPEFAALCRESALNVYLWSPATFHHKVVDLLACQRPILAFPGERAESLQLAEGAGGNLIVCTDQAQVRQALDRVWRGDVAPAAETSHLQHLTWTARAADLEAVLRRAVVAGPAGAP